MLHTEMIDSQLVQIHTKADLTMLIFLSTEVLIADVIFSNVLKAFGINKKVMKSS